MPPSKFPLNQWVPSTRKVRGVLRPVLIRRRWVRGKTTYEVRVANQKPTRLGEFYNKQAPHFLALTSWEVEHLDLPTARSVYKQNLAFRSELFKRMENATNPAERRRLQRAIDNTHGLEGNVVARIERLETITNVGAINQTLNIAQRASIENRRLTPQTIKTLKVLSEGEKEFGGGIELEDRANQQPMKIVARKGSTSKSNMDLGDDTQVTFHTHPPRVDPREPAVTIPDDGGILQSLKSEKARAEYEQIRRDLNDLVNRATISANPQHDQAGNVVGIEGDITAFDMIRRIDPTLIVAGDHIVRVIDTAPSPDAQTRAARAKQFDYLRRVAYAEAMKTSEVKYAKTLAEFKRRAQTFEREYKRNFINAARTLGLDVAITTRDSIEVPVMRRRRVKPEEQQKYRKPVE